MKIMSTGKGVDNALALWRDQLGREQVISEPLAIRHYGPNISEYPPRKIVAALRPNTAEGVRLAVTIASHCRVALYPVSRGCNWGLGSKLPPGDGCAILDLSAMDSVVRIDEQLGYAIVQPGVTQEKLASELSARKLPWRLNVTGAGSATSVVANALERGVGMLGQRHRDLMALEVVLSSGELLRRGFDHLHYPVGAGPDLTGLFVQSNFGIVTQAAIRLAPKLDVSLFFAETEATQFPHFVDDLRQLRQRGDLDHRTEIMAHNDPRVAGRISPGEASSPAWGTWGAIYGDLPLRQYRRERILRTLSQSCRAVTFYDEDSRDMDDLAEDISARFDLARGIPSNHSLDSMQRAFGLEEINPDLDHEYRTPGMLAILPAVPLVGERLRQIVEMVIAEGRTYEIDPVISFSTISDIAAEGFIRAHFDRMNQDAVARAHRWERQVDRRLCSEGLPILRLNLGQMPAFASADKVNSRVISAIGGVLDPDDIIAPGRYQPDWP